MTGGEACSLSAAASVVGIASDIGGSIRMPAFFNGVFGHKATTGLSVCLSVCVPWNRPKPFTSLLILLLRSSSFSFYLHHCVTFDQVVVIWLSQIQWFVSSLVYQPVILSYITISCGFVDYWRCRVT